MPVEKLPSLLRCAQRLGQSDAFACGSRAQSTTDCAVSLEIITDRTAGGIEHHPATLSSHYAQEILSGNTFFSRI